MAHGETYDEFVEKFKPKHTTDDCFTPPVVYDAVLDWVVKTYGVDRSKVLRPFWPGMDYEAESYEDGCVVAHGVNYRLKKEDACFVRALDSQREAGKSIFGSGFLLSEKAAAEKAAREKSKVLEWRLSEREKEIIKNLK